VTIPYWDWTTPASGVRFPKAFEDESSPLFHAGRYRQVTPGTPRIQWDADEVKTKMVQEPDWLLFAGEPLDAQGQGGSFGWVEDGPHNATHGDIGPTMGDPETASRDPIYWSFHAYIDLIWARWQKVHTDATHPQPFTAPQTKVWVEPFTPQVGDMAQTDTLPVGYAYGYDYDFSIDQAPIMVGSSSQPVQRTLEAARSGERVVTTAPLRVGRANRHLLRVRDVAVLPDVTYSIRAYVHPPSLDVRTAGQAERDRYLADTATVWMSGGHAHHPTNVILDLTKAIAPFADKEFEITVLSETRPLPQSAAEMGPFVDLNRKVAASGPLWRSPCWKSAGNDQRSAALRAT
jgi:tyrosinase